MVNQVSGNLINGYFNSGVTTPNFRATQPDLSQINVKKPEKTNLIEDYLRANGYYNQNFVSSTTGDFTPSEVKGLQNYIESDNNGNIIASNIYTKNGSEIKQISTSTSPDGTTFERVLTTVDGSAKLDIVVKDKSGNVLFERNKTHKRLTDDMAVTTINGKEYKITGLTENYIKIEHNGTVGVIDMKKLIDSQVLELKEEEGKGCERNPRKEELTSSERKKLEKKIRCLPADDLIRLAQSVEKVKLLTYEGGGCESFFDFNDCRKELHLGLNIKSDITLHELGHGYNHLNEEKLKSDNVYFNNVADYESKNMKQSRNLKLRTDELAYGKFVDYEDYMDWAKISEQEAKQHLRDEIYAEGYSILNNMEIEPSSEMLSMRFLGVMKHFPKSIAKINNTL